MAFTENMSTRSYVTGAAVSQYRFIVMTAGLAAHVGTAGVRADAVSITDAASGKAVAAAYNGRVSVVAAGTIAKGAAVASDATGKAITATTGQIILGTALEDAVSGQVITMDIRLDGTAA